MADFKSMLPGSVPELQTERLVLDGLGEADRAAYNRLCLDDGRNRWWGYDYREDLVGELTEDFFLASAREDFRSGQGLHFAVRLDGALIGEVELHSFDGAGGAELGCRILPEYAGHGYGAEAYRRGLAWALEGLGLERVAGKCYRENEASRKMLSGCMEPIGQDGTFLYFEKRADREEISLCPMTRALCHELFKGWENDPAVYGDMDRFAPYVYDGAAVDRYFDAKQEPGRVVLAVLLGGRPIGELQLKRIDREKGACTLSIHLQSDAVKGRGYGTRAERLALAYAFGELGLAAVDADTLIKNTRSQHVLEKVGFRFVEERDGFRYYRCARTKSG